ncbi:MAG TPA: hypothetical protein VFG84_06365 [Gemmatimonadaceae bacterium]|nr:hypothetical protein [Gemmatimonadaceae bacterium]
MRLNRFIFGTPVRAGDPAIPGRILAIGGRAHDRAVAIELRDATTSATWPEADQSDALYRGDLLHALRMESSHQ